MTAHLYKVHFTPVSAFEIKAYGKLHLILILYLCIGNLLTPIIHVLSTTAWGFASPDGSPVERYTVEFECRLRNITFVEKYMSVSASGGTGRVATSASCFGGLGQLYRVKVWAVSGPNISRQPAVKCLTPGGQCMIKGDNGEHRCSLHCVQLPAVYQL